MQRATIKAVESLVEERTMVQKEMVTVRPVPSPPLLNALTKGNTKSLATHGGSTALASIQERDNCARLHHANESVPNHPSCFWPSSVPPPMAPFRLSSQYDALHLSKFQVFLRLNIEAFAATPMDVVIRTRGRNKAIQVHQVGLRCRHCAHVPAMQRVKGAVYFPSSTLGLYQAAQNMSTSHLQCGMCPQMTESIKTMFAQLLGTKTASSSSASGRAYWAHCAQHMGLVDTEFGIFPATK
jgi:hypothetical protein